jgi:hypothetical protein
MQTLITEAQVAQLAFRAPDFISEDAVSKSTIIVAEYKYVRPVLGGAMCEALRRGDYPDLLTEFVQPALALYVKMLMIVSLAVQTGRAGVVEVQSKNLAKASEKKMRAAVNRLRDEARALMRRTVEHVESAPEGKYPEYDSRENILNRYSTDGGIVLPKS